MAEFDHFNSFMAKIYSNIVVKSLSIGGEVIKTDV
jgi:hypothetical protein